MPTMLLPSKTMSPRSGLSSPMSILSITLLPTPEPPRIVRASPCSMDRLRPV